MNSESTVGFLRTATAQLERCNVAEPRLKAELILSQGLGCRRLELPLQSDRILAQPVLRDLDRQIRRLRDGEPVQYVLGRTDFIGRPFMTDFRALIPRPETEELVERTLAEETLWKSPAPAVADVGTGSGCIVISLALARPQGRYLATDVSEAALDLARENATALGVAGRVQFVRTDLLSGIPAATLDAVVSNPPYVAAAQWEGLARDIREHEPRLALDGGADGLAVIARLLPQAHAALKPGGLLLVEIGEDQAERVVSLARSAGYAETSVRKDLSGHDRIFRGVRPG